MDESCPFCDPDPDQVFLETDLVIGLWDKYPISPGHALLVPRRHVAGWFDASAEERSALMAALDIARDKVLELHQPDGFNIGVNSGEAAGQTIFHLHVHLIPRYTGDQEDPRGGVRNIIPDRADYWTPATKG